MRNRLLELLVGQPVHERKLADTFVGPGLVECNRGECEFSVDFALSASSDPCHTRTHDHMYDSSFQELSFVYTDPSNDDGNPSFYRYASNIDTDFPDEYVKIQEGCTATCTGCSFAPTETIQGPAQVECDDGRCIWYTTDPNFECGTEIEAASDSYGSFSTLLWWENTSHSFYGYEGINSSVLPINIPGTCKLDCSGCSLV